MIKKKIYYWSPHLTEIATIKAVINSAYSIKRFFKEYDPTILDAAGEFEKKKKEIDDKKIGLINLYKFRYISFLPTYGKIYSRFSYLVIFLLSFFSLKNDMALGLSAMEIYDDIPDTFILNNLELCIRIY